MSATERSNKDKEMASFMKKHNIERRSSQCPLCHNQVGLSAMYQHIVSCRQDKYKFRQDKPQQSKKAA